MRNLKLTNPVICAKITQKFGCNQACLSKDGSVKRKILGLFCPPWSREYYPAVGYIGHPGIDFDTSVGEFCRYGGPPAKVVKVKRHGAIEVWVRTIDKYPFEGGEYYAEIGYVHLNESYVEEGDGIVREMILGLCGNTGNSSSPHTHVELKPVNELGIPIFEDNGYDGAIDPLPYMV